jgi:hypothetical protein
LSNATRIFWVFLLRCCNDLRLGANRDFVCTFRTFICSAGAQFFSTNDSLRTKDWDALGRHALLSHSICGIGLGIGEAKGSHMRIAYIPLFLGRYAIHSRRMHLRSGYIWHGGTRTLQASSMSGKQALCYYDTYVCILGGSLCWSPTTRDDIHSQLRSPAASRCFHVTDAKFIFWYLLHHALLDEKLLRMLSCAS